MASKNTLQLTLNLAPARTDVLAFVPNPTDPATEDSRTTLAALLGKTLETDLTFSDVTTNDASTSKHGYAPKLPNDATKFRDGTGTYVQAGWVRLGQVVTSGSQATVDFQTISALFSQLRVDYFTRDTAAGTGGSALYLKINADATSGDYTAAVRSGTNNTTTITSQVAASGGGYIGDQPNDGNTSGLTAHGEVRLVGYASTATHKRVQADNEYETAAAFVLQLTNFRWASTVAVNRLTFVTAGTAFKDGSIFTLYGIP